MDVLHRALHLQPPAPRSQDHLAGLLGILGRRRWRCNTLIAVRPLRTWGTNGGRGTDLVQIEIAPRWDPHSEGNGGGNRQEVSRNR